MTTVGYGTILDVSTVNVGEWLAADALAGATTITVTDASTFNEAGGQITLGTTVYTYTGAAPDTGVLTLASGLAADALADGRVELYPAQAVKTALVDLTAVEGDAVTVTVPHNLAAVLADGMREDSLREVVLVEERDTGELYVTDISSRSRITADVLLEEGGVSPDRLSMGVAGNMVQDPIFKTNVREAPDRWTIQGPDTVYPDSNFVRVAGTTTLNVAHNGGGVNDRTWWLTDLIPVDPGRSVRVAAQVRRDAASTTSTSGTVRARVRVIFYKDDKISSTSTVDHLEEFLLATDTVVDTWTPISLSVEVPEGYSHFQAGVQVTYQQQGNIDFIKPEVQVLWNRVQSSKYVQGETSWSLDDETAQFENVNVIGEVGADTVTARTLTVGGLDVETEFLAPLAKGLTGYGAAASGTASATITGEATLFRGEYTDIVKAGRAYLVTLLLHGGGSAAVNDVDIRVRYTTDGSLPGITSTVMRVWRLPQMNTAGRDHFLGKIYSPVADYERWRFAVTAQATAGGFISTGSAGRTAELSLVDVGTYMGQNGDLAQISKASGVADVDPPSTYTRSWSATWARSFDGDNSARSPDGNDLYQGYISGTHGNTRALFGFDYADIQSKLAGATINWIKLTWRMKHAWANSGITLRIATHTYAARPSSWADANVNVASAGTQGGCREGSTYTKTLANTIGNQLRDGTIKGLGFGPGASNSPSTYYGYMYGDGSSRPKITVNYTK